MTLNDTLNHQFGCESFQQTNGFSTIKPVESLVGPAQRPIDHNLVTYIHVYFAYTLETWKLCLQQYRPGASYSSYSSNAYLSLSVYIYICYFLIHLRVSVDIHTHMYMFKCMYVFLYPYSNAQNTEAQYRYKST